jgi:hypothetical protein
MVNQAEYEELIATTKRYLEEVEEWVKENDWLELPEGVRMTLVRGESSLKEIIERYERRLEKEKEE